MGKRTLLKICSCIVIFALAACQQTPTTLAYKIVRVDGHDIAVKETETEGVYEAFHNAAAERSKSGDQFTKRQLEAIRQVSECDIASTSKNGAKSIAKVAC